jgi:hypothetical protein
MQQSRTASTLPLAFNVPLIELHKYQRIGRQAQGLRQQGLSWVKIAKELGASDKTAKKAALSASCSDARSHLRHSIITKIPDEKVTT